MLKDRPLHAPQGTALARRDIVALRCREGAVPQQVRSDADMFRVVLGQRRGRAVAEQMAVHVMTKALPRVLL
jgi:hypothetical protein